MGSQRLDRVVAPGEVGLGQGRVDFLVADVMQKDGRPALSAAQPWRQVMQALRHVRRNRAPAQGTDRVVFHDR